MPSSEILAGIAEYQDSYHENRELFERLAHQGQAPGLLFIACSDSRVAPELITSAKPGELFVARTLGNIVPPFGTGQMGVGAIVEFAVLHLRIHEIVLCGHTDCGGIQALDTPPDWARASHITRWIEYARPARTRVEASGLPAEERHVAIVRANVLLQLEHLRSYDPVREGEKAGTLTLHGWVFHLESGALERYDPPTLAWLPLRPDV